MITFVFVNLANLILNRSRKGIFLYKALPIAGIAVDCYLLTRSFFIEQWGQGMMGRTAIGFDVACALIACGALL